MIDIEEIIEELRTNFIDQNCKIFYNQNDKEKILLHYKKCIFAILNSNKEEIYKNFDDLVNLKLLKYAPYTIIFNEINFIQNRIIEKMIKDKDAIKIYNICKLFKNMENHVAKTFLEIYLEELKRKNNIRASSIDVFKEKNIIKYYLQHIVWLDKLALAVKEFDINLFSEINPKKCEFGQWLNNSARLTISNNSQYKNLVNSHEKLHQLSNEIKSLMYPKINIEYMAILTTLKKCEAISVDIGIELSFIKSSTYMQQAYYDKLTNLLNRNYLDDIYESAFKLSKITNKPFCMAMCDIDDFKNVNDNHGHDFGDYVLKTFANYLKTSLRDSDYIIRYGGEEFLIIFPSTSLENAVLTIEKCIDNLQNLNIQNKTNTTYMTVSFGLISINPNDGDRYEFDIENSIHKVDQKLYEAKHDGKNRVKF